MCSQMKPTHFHFLYRLSASDLHFLLSHFSFSAFQFLLRLLTQLWLFISASHVYFHFSILLLIPTAHFRIPSQRLLSTFIFDVLPSIPPTSSNLTSTSFYPYLHQVVEVVVEVLAQALAEIFAGFIGKFSGVSGIVGIC